MIHFIPGWVSSMTRFFLGEFVSSDYDRKLTRRALEFEVSTFWPCDRKHDVFNLRKGSNFLEGKISLFQGNLGQ